MSSPNSSRWLVTINGRVPTDRDMDVLGQTSLYLALARHGEMSALISRAEFVDNEPAAKAFHANASREFPEDDVRLWTSVDPSTTDER